MVVGYHETIANYTTNDKQYNPYITADTNLINATYNMWERDYFVWVVRLHVVVSRSQRSGHEKSF